MPSQASSDIDKIIGHLEDRLLPTELRVGSENPEWYESEMSERYEERMRKRARRLLQSVSPQKRKSMLAFFEHEEEVRDLLSKVSSRKEELKELGYHEDSVRTINDLHDLLLESREKIATQSYSDFVEEHPTLGLFFGEDGEEAF